MTLKRMEYGREAERIAASFLHQKGYHIVEKNYKTRLGEIDLIAWDQKYLVFVEVKARINTQFGGPVAAMTPNKQNKIARLAKIYMTFKKIDCPVRFDVVLITGPAHSPSIELIRNAFDAGL